VNQRLNWLLLSQAFLFAALTTIIASDKIDSILKIWIPFGIAIVGALFNIYSFVGLRAAYASLKNLRESWYSVIGKETEQGLQNGFPKITWTGKQGQRAINTATSTPLIILTVWWLVAVFIFPVQYGWIKWAIIALLTLVYFWEIRIMIYETRNN